MNEAMVAAPEANPPKLYYALDVDDARAEAASDGTPKGTQFLAVFPGAPADAYEPESFCPGASAYIVTAGFAAAYPEVTAKLAAVLSVVVAKGRQLSLALSENSVTKESFGG
jgi:hypothetical protein